MKNITIIALSLFMLVSCTHQEHVRSVYYWQTTLRLDSTERTFLHKHNINKVYCRYFDVVIDDNGEPKPNATIAFDDTFPKHVQIVPVVYILNDCMKHHNLNLAPLIFNRIMKMDDVNGIHGVREIQIDCDWTMSTREQFFAFLEDMRRMCHDRNMILSATIRLHQLSQPVPPVDRGVLMMYNTGDVTKRSVDKPILDIKDVMPYMRYLKDYRLNLSTAYPLFTWRVLFRGGKYVGIMHGDDDLPVLPGDEIVIRQATMEDIGQVQRAVNNVRRDANDEVILYDLSDKNIKRFGFKYIERIYNNKIDKNAIYD